MSIIRHPEDSKVAIAVPSAPKQYIANGSIGAILSERCDDAMDAYRRNAIAAHKGEVLIASVRANKLMTFEPHYVQKPFFEMWVIPVNSAKFTLDGTGEEPGLLKPKMLSSFLMHGRSSDNFAELQTPLEEEALLQCLEDPDTAKNAGFESDEEYILDSVLKGLDRYVFQFSYEKDISTAHNSTYYYLTWSVRPPTDNEKKLIDLVQVLRGTQPEAMVNDIYEKAHLKATGAIAELPAAPETAQLNGSGKKAKAAAK